MSKYMLISVCERNIITEQFDSFEDARKQMMKELENDFVEAGYDEFYDEDGNELTWNDIKDLREFDGGWDFCFYEGDAWSNVWEDSKMDWKIVEIQ